MQGPRKIGKNVRLQSGINHQVLENGVPQAGSKFHRGVVMATYVTDDDKHPRSGDLKDPPSAVYCDVLIMPSEAGQRWFILRQVLVTQAKGGLHDDELWKPKATKMNIVTQTLDDQLSINPAQLDGDWVLVAYLNDSFDEPMILRGLSHPSKDIGNDLYGTGKRLKLKQVDGHPDFRKHNGVFRGVDTDGNHVVDSTFGHNGELLPGGLEPLPDTTGTSGNQTNNLPKDATHQIVFYDMTIPLAPVEVAKFSCTEEHFEILLNFLPCLKVEGSAGLAKLTLGDGIMSALIAERVQNFWTTTVKPWLEAITVPTGTGPSGTPLNAPAPPWDTSTHSTKLKFPDG